MGKLRNLIREYIARLVIQSFTLETIKAALDSLVGYLEAKSKETETVIDDWFVEALRNIVNDEKNLECIYNFLKKYVVQADGVCCSLPTEKSLEALAGEIAEIANDDTVAGDVCKSIGLTQWLTIIQIIVPILIDAFDRLYMEKK